ncbi:MAG: hypothetical protein ABSG82_01345 [Sedimentisphaerales bacterium]|jgi:hypothetical protein
MAKRNYGILPFFLSFIAMVISTLFFFLPLFARVGIISYECSNLILPWGWILGFVLALVSLYMVSGSKDLLRKIIVWIFSLLAIILATLWATLVLAPLP